jgi:hypothetical protein
MWNGEWRMANGEERQSDSGRAALAGMTHLVMEQNKRARHSGDRRESRISRHWEGEMRIEKSNVEWRMANVKRPPGISDSHLEPRSFYLR